MEGEQVQTILSVCNILGGAIIVTYAPLWNTLKAKGYSKNYLKKNGIDGKIMSRMNNGRPISIITLERICRLLDCGASDVLDFTVVDGENIFDIEIVNKGKKGKKQD